jgi:hypothetical protein
MELYIPSLAVILLAFFIIFVILRTLSSTALVFIAILIFVLAGLQHANLFTYEYAASTWQNISSGSSNTMITIVLIIMMGGFVFNLIGRGGAKSNTNVSRSAAVSATAPTAPTYGLNTLKSMIRDPLKSR